MSAALFAGAGVANAEDGASSADSGSPASARATEAESGSGTSRQESAPRRGPRVDRTERAESTESTERAESRRAALRKDSEPEPDAEPEPERDRAGVGAELDNTASAPADVAAPDPDPAPAETALRVRDRGPVAADEAGVEVDEPGDGTFVQSIETDLSSRDDAVVMRASAAQNPWVGAANGLAEVFDTLNDIGTAVYNLYTRTMEFFAGPVRAPFGSRVRAERSELVLGDGVEVKADWYFPTNTRRPTGIIYFQHGFLATASFYSATAAYLAEKTNSIVVAPTLTWNVFDIENYPLMLPHTYRAVADLFTGDRAALQASAELAGYSGRLPQRLVLSGHSAGGGTAVGVAGYLAERGEADNLAGVVMLDGAAFFGTMGAALAKVPTSIPVYNLAAEPDNWNIYGEASYHLAKARPGAFTGIQISGGNHSDAMQSASPTVQFLTYLATGFSAPWNIAASGTVAAGWIGDLLKGTHTPKFYGKPGSSLEIIAGWWRKEAEVLSLETIPLSSLHELFACLLNPAAVDCRPTGTLAA